MYQKYQVKKADDTDYRPALELALRVFMECDAEDYGSEHTQRMREAIAQRLTNLDIYEPGKRLIYVAKDENKIIGIIETYGNNRISLMFVDGAYQRQGIATALMNQVSRELKNGGYDRIVLNSSPNGLPFYTKYGFIVLEDEKNPETPWKTPMCYELIYV